MEAGDVPSTSEILTSTKDIFTGPYSEKANFSKEDFKNKNFKNKVVLTNGLVLELHKEWVKCRFSMKTLLFAIRSLSSVDIHYSDAYLNSRVKLVVEQRNKFQKHWKVNEEIRKKAHEFEKSVFYTPVERPGKRSATAEEDVTAKRVKDQLEQHNCTLKLRKEIDILKNKIKSYKVEAVKKEEIILNLKEEVRKLQKENSTKTFEVAKVKRNCWKSERKIKRLENRLSIYKNKLKVKMERCILQKEQPLSADVEELLQAYEVSKDQAIKIDELKEMLKKQKSLTINMKKKAIYYKRKLTKPMQIYKKRIEKLENVIFMKEKQIESLHRKLDMEQHGVANLMSEGKYTDDVRIAVIALHDLGLTSTNISKAISLIGKDMLKLKIPHLPSASSCNTMILEGRYVAQYQVAESLLDQGNQDVCLHTDASKNSKNYGSLQLSPSKGHSSAGPYLMESESAATVFRCNKSVLEDLAKTYSKMKNIDEKEVLEQLAINTKNIVSDQGAANKQPFAKLYESWRESLISSSEKLGTMTPEEVGQLKKVNSFHCWFHFIINLARHANNAFKGFEHLANLQLKAGGSVTFQTVARAAELFTIRGLDKNGLYREFMAVVGNDKNMFHRQSGNREYVFDNAVSLYYHYKKGHITALPSKLKCVYPKLSELEKNLASTTIISGIKAMCIMKFSIIDPIWKQMEEINSILEINELSHEIQKKLKSWKDNAMPLRSGEEKISLLETEEAAHDVKSLVFMEDTEDIERMTVQALEFVCFNWLIFIERYNKEQLPGGKYWNPSKSLKEDSKNVSVHNMISERDFSWLDRLIKIKPSASTLHIEAVLMTSLNKTPEYLLQLKEEERKHIMEEARRHTEEARKWARQRSEEIKGKRREMLMIRKKAGKENEDKKLIEERREETFLLEKSFQEDKEALHMKLLKQRTTVLPGQHLHNEDKSLAEAKKYISKEVLTLDIEPEYLVGKEVDHIINKYDESGKLLPRLLRTYEGKILRITKTAQNPLDYVFEIKYDVDSKENENSDDDSKEPEQHYYYELMKDYITGNLIVKDYSHLDSDSWHPDSESWDAGSDSE